MIDLSRAVYSSLTLGRRLLVILWLLGVGAEPLVAAPPALRVTASFSGGSGQVVAIDQKARRVRVEPKQYKDLGWPCWWYIKVSGLVPGEKLTLEVGDSPFATPERASYSTDGVSWKQTAAGYRGEKKTMVYRQPVEAEEAWFAWGPPFTVEDAEKLVRDAARASPYATRYELCQSRGGRSVPALRVAQSGARDADRYGIWIQARQHAWESGSSWVCRGLVEWLVSDDARAESLRKCAAITLVPVVDVDNVALGAGGKEQKPHDHNRDWSNDPYFPATRAAMAEIKRQNEGGRFDMFIDLHNPSPADREPFFFITPRALLTERGQRNLDRFLGAARLEISGPLAFDGLTRESDEKYDPKWQLISKNWVSAHTAEHVTALTLETAWNTSDSTAEGYRTVGRQLGQAMERHLRVSPRK